MSLNMLRRDTSRAQSAITNLHFTFKISRFLNNDEAYAAHNRKQLQKECSVVRFSI